jgi:hypothetical protein
MLEYATVAKHKLVLKFKADDQFPSLEALDGFFTCFHVLSLGVTGQ